MARRQVGRSRRVLTVGYLLFLAITVVSWVGLDLIAARFADVDLTDINQRPAIWADTILLTVVAFAWEVRRRLRQDEGSIWWIRMGAAIGLLVHRVPVNRRVQPANARKRSLVCRDRRPSHS